MKALSACLLLLTCFAGMLGCTWFLCLVLHLPAIVCPVLASAATALLYKILYRQESKQASIPVSRWQWILVAAGIFLIVNRCYHIAEIHGGWDAWDMWNQNAKILSDPAHWEAGLVGRSPGHDDYPLLLPALNGMLMHFFGAASQDIAPFTVAMFSTLVIPLLLFTALAQRSGLVATGVLLWFATNDVFLFEGSSQYVDTPLALFYLASFICLDWQSHTLRDRRIMDSLAGFFAGAAAFTKNEGILFLVILLAIYGIFLLRKRRLAFFGLGLLLPISCLLIFRIGWPAGNDLMAGSLKRLLNGPSWQMILNRLYDLFCGEYLVLQIVLAFVLVIAAFRRQSPGKSFFVMLLLLFGYCAVYTLTPYSLEWHLHTSQSRLLHGLQPALIYASLAFILGKGRDDGMLLRMDGSKRAGSVFLSIRASLR